MLMRLAQWVAAPRVQARFNGVLTVVWLVMMPVTLAFIGPFSTVLWVSFVSAWALFATHLGAWIAALVNVKAERIEDHASNMPHHAVETQRRLDHIIKHSDLPPLP